MKTVYAYFQPQTIIDETFINCACPVAFDITKKLLSMGKEKASKLEDNRESTDSIVPKSILREHRRNYGLSAAFYVYGVEEAVAELFKV